MEQVFALHGLLQQRAVLQHQRLDLVQQVSVLLLQVALQLTQQLRSTFRRRTAHLSSRIVASNIPLCCRSAFIT